MFFRSYDTHTFYHWIDPYRERERGGERERETVCVREREREGRGESFRHFVHSDSREHFYGCWLERSFGVVGVYVFVLFFIYI